MILLDNPKFRQLVKVVAIVTIFTFTFEQVALADGGSLLSRDKLRVLNPSHSNASGDLTAELTGKKPLISEDEYIECRLSEEGKRLLQPVYPGIETIKAYPVNSQEGEHLGEYDKDNKSLEFFTPRRNKVKIEQAVGIVVSQLAKQELLRQEEERLAHIEAAQARQEREQRIKAKKIQEKLAPIPTDSSQSLALMSWIRHTFVEPLRISNPSPQYGRVMPKLLLTMLVALSFFGSTLLIFRKLKTQPAQVKPTTKITQMAQPTDDSNRLPKVTPQTSAQPVQGNGIKSVIPDRYPLILFQRSSYPQLNSFVHINGSDIACMSYRNFASGPNGILDISAPIRGANVPYWLGVETLNGNLVDQDPLLAAILTFNNKLDALARELSGSIDGIESSNDMNDLRGIYIHSGRSSKDPNAKAGENDDSDIFNNERLREELKDRVASRLGNRYFATFAWSPREQILADRNYFAKRVAAGVNCVIIDGQNFRQMNASERNAIFEQAQKAGIRALMFVGGDERWLNNNADAATFYQDLVKILDNTDTKSVQVMIADDTEIKPNVRDLSAYNKLIAGSTVKYIDSKGQMTQAKKLGQDMSRLPKPKASVVSIGETGGPNTVIIDINNKRKIKVTEPRQSVLIPPRFFNQQPQVKATVKKFKSQVDAIVNEIKVLGRHPSSNLQGEPKWADTLSPVPGRPTVVTLWEKIDKKDMRSFIRWCKAKGVTEIEYESRHMAGKEESIIDVFAFIKFASENGITVVLTFSGTEAIAEPKIGLRYLDLIKWTNINNVLDGPVRIAFDIEPTQLPNWDSDDAPLCRSIMFDYAKFIQMARFQTGSHISVYIAPFYVKMGFGEALDYYQIDDEVDVIYMAYGRTAAEILALLGLNHENVLTIKDDVGNTAKTRDFYIAFDISQIGAFKPLRGKNGLLSRIKKGDFSIFQNFYFKRNKMMEDVRNVDKHLKMPDKTPCKLRLPKFRLL